MSKTTDANFKFNLGDKAKDEITGLEGIVVSRTQWLHQCNTYAIQPTGLSRDGSILGKEWLDEPQIKLIEEDVHEPSQETGGPERAVPQTNRM